jgi:hypothetical protein
MATLLLSRADVRVAPQIQTEANRLEKLPQPERAHKQSTKLRIVDFGLD